MSVLHKLTFIFCRILISSSAHHLNSMNYKTRTLKFLNHLTLSHCQILSPQRIISAPIRNVKPCGAHIAIGVVDNRGAYYHQPRFKLQQQQQQHSTGTEHNNNDNNNAHCRAHHRPPEPVHQLTERPRTTAGAISAVSNDLRQCWPTTTVAELVRRKPIWAEQLEQPVRLGQSELAEWSVR